ncbi:MAG: SusC/RagA family TonB-linked outer membrane protein, partial [Bacteroidales bacterium]|nr:SusC/RagA family TonB-linked outer membrane protein [Bacteroidales bacterium]
VIIDGVPGSMSYLNPEDIKSVSVLKDAATQAIYGARAAAGVILVETKRGEKATEPRITMSAYYGIDDLPKRREMCNAAEFVQVRQWALENAGEPQERWPAYISAFKSDPSRFADTDWQKEYYQVGLSQKYDVGYVAGNSNMNVAFSGYYSEIKGIAVATSSDKYGFRLNSDVRRGRWKIGESVNFGHEDIIPVESSGFDTMYQVTNIEPLVFVYDENNDGGFGGAVAGMGMSDAGNPVAFNKLIDTKNHYDGLSASGYISYSPIDGLVFKFQGSDNLNFSHSKAFTPTYQIGALKPNPDATLSESRSMSNRYLMELTSNFDRSFGGLHNVSALLGVSQENYSFNDLSAFAKKFENNLMTYLEHGQKDFAVGGGHSRYGLRSAFGRLGYNYGNRYIAMFSARYDGSSRFAEGNKWGFFPSASLAWNIANERFWEPLSSTVSTFKFRLSYGALGNQGIGNYQYIPTLSSATNSLNYPFAGLNDISLGYAITSLPSLNIKWESTYTSNIGIDLGFLGGKLQMSAD